MIRRTTSTSLALAGAVLAALVSVPATASAAPVAADDGYALYAGGTYTVDPLANDDTTLLSIGELSLCGVSGVDRQRLYVVQSGDTLVVEVRDGIRGRTQFRYEACQGNQRATGVVTVDVRRLTDVTGARKKGTRRKALFTNPNAVPVRLSYGSISSGRPDGTRTIAPRSSITVATNRKALFWVALHVDDGAVVRVGDGTVRGLQTAPPRR